MSRPTARTPSARSPRRGPGRSGGPGGRSARQTPAKAARAATQAARTAPRPVRRWAALASIGVVLAILLVPTVRNYLHQRGQISALRSEVAQQKSHIAQLQGEQERWRDPSYVEQQARERLKFVMPGDKAYTVIDPDPPEEEQPGIAHLPDNAPTRPWYGQLWESAKVADRTTGAP
jgi:cell division protein FtsB